MAAPFTLKAAKMETRMIFTLGQYDNFHLMTVLGQCTSLLCSVLFLFFECARACRVCARARVCMCVCVQGKSNI